MPGSWYQLQRVPAARPPGSRPGLRPAAAVPGAGSWYQLRRGACSCRPGSLPVPPWFRIAPGTSCRPLRPLSTCKEGKPARAAPGISCPRPDFCGVSAAPPPVFGLLQLPPVRIAAGSPGTSCAGCRLPAAARGFGGNSPDFVRIPADFDFFPLFSDFFTPAPFDFAEIRAELRHGFGLFALRGFYVPLPPVACPVSFPFPPQG